MTTLNPRIIPGALAGIAVMTAAVVGGWLWCAFVLVGFVVGFYELQALMLAKDIRISRVMVLLVSTLFMVLAIFQKHQHFQLVVTAGVSLTFVWLLFRKSRATISDVGGTILSFFYVGYLPAHYILLRNMPLAGQELGYLLICLFAVSFSDIGGYYGGKMFGKNLLSPQISPRKTVEGSIFSVLSGFLITQLVGAFFGIAMIHRIILGLLIPVVAIWGDLFESLLKRDAGIKDTGTLLPGHGGLLDRTDSYIFSGVVVYYYCLWFVMHQGLYRELVDYIKPLLGLH